MSSLSASDEVEDEDVRGRTESLEDLQVLNNTISRRLSQREEQLKASKKRLSITQTMLEANRQELEQMKQEFERYKEDVSKTVETPLESLVRTSSEIKDDQLKTQFETILRSLASTQIYRPTFAKIKETLSSPKKGEVINEKKHVDFLMEIYSGNSSQASQQTVRRRRSSLIGKRLKTSTIAFFSSDETTEETDDQLVSNIDSLDFDPSIYSMQNVLYFTMYKFNQLGVIECLETSQSILERFAVEVQKKYRKNPYHNYYHAFETLRVLILVLDKTKLTDILDDFLLSCLAVAALCHDVDHPGTVNLFEVRTRSQIAITYNDVSVLENHHSAQTFRILLKEESNIFSNSTTTEYATARKLIISSILATDMAKHFELMSQFKLKEKVHGRLTKDMIGKDSTEKDDHDFFICNLILHFADISTPMHGPAFCNKWVKSLAREFENTSKREIELGLPPTEFLMDNSLPAIATREIGFIDYIFFPLLNTVIEKFGAIPLCVKNAERNKEAWKLVKETGKPYLEAIQILDECKEI